ncbi:MAG: nucleotide exchange factor GrpE [Propionibacteriaceae bacterium]
MTHVPGDEPIDAALEALLAEEAAKESGIDTGDSAVDEAVVTGDADVSQTADVDPLADAERQLRERTEDLQRVQAEYMNYKRRVDRDREVAKQSGIEKVMTELLPVLDAIAMAGQHDELTGGFKAVADELIKVTTKFGIETYGQAGDIFDPQIHDALMQVPGEQGQTDPLVAQVLQAGYRLGDRIVRHARVAVAEPA